MQNAGAVLTDAWVKQKDAEAADFKKWDKKKQTQWQVDYLSLSLRAFKMAQENATEAKSRISAVRDGMKTALEGVDKIIKDKRAKNEPLSDAERAWIAKGKQTIEGSDAAIAAIIKSYSDNSPFAGRLDYYAGVIKAGALPADAANKIKAVRLPSIDIGNEFGKSGPLTQRIAEYRARWAVLMKEVDGLAKQNAGKGPEWAKQLNDQLKAFQAGMDTWSTDLDATVGKVSRNLTNALGKIDSSTPKNFGASLLKAIKTKASSKEKDKAKNDAENIKLNLKMGQDRLKEAKGSLKTRTMEYKSLEAQLKDAGPYAEPQRKVLAALGTKLAAHQSTVDALAKDIDGAVAAAGK